eukprot:m.117187 g.117187  ORF g.117187 m.117187 type:complete len:236 (-) comp16091_c0_seq2:538-1245(-)
MATKADAELDNLMGAFDFKKKEEKTEGSTGIFGNCVKCKTIVVGKNNGCSALGNLWHTSCFHCADCNTSLFNAGGFFEKKGKVYCESDFLARMAPKCHDCKKPILDEIVKANNANFHPECFKCNGCKTTLQDKPFIPKDDQTYCRMCWHKQFGMMCARCNQAILPEGHTDEARCMKAIGNTYHVNCYSCHECDKKFASGEKQGAYPVDGKLYCYDHALVLYQKKADEQAAAQAHS